MSSQGTTTEATERSRACAQNCTVAGLRGTGMKIALPGPAHLPVVSDPDEVAAWHAEIFERLAAARAGSAPTQYCKLDLRVQPAGH